MSKHYLKAAKPVLEMVGHLINLHYPKLRHAQVRVEVLTVHSDKEGEPALTLRGRTCGAIIRKTSVRERAAGRADAEIVIDSAYFQKLEERQRYALLDHELCHLEVCYDKLDEVKTDTNGRPILAMREHDYEVGWFHEIAERYGEDSGEVMQARTLLKGKLGQIYFAFTENQAALAAGASAISRLQETAAEHEVSMTISSPEVGGVRIDKEGVHPMPPAGEDNSDIAALLPAALKTIKELQVASISGIQRRLRIGFGRARSVMEELAKLGVLGAEQPTGKREILVDLATYELPQPATAAA